MSYVMIVCKLLRCHTACCCGEDMGWVFPDDALWRLCRTSSSHERMSKVYDPLLRACKINKKRVAGSWYKSRVNLSQFIKHVRFIPVQFRTKSIIFTILQDMKYLLSLVLWCMYVLQLIWYKYGQQSTSSEILVKYSKQWLATSLYVPKTS